MPLIKGCPPQYLSGRFALRSEIHEPPTSHRNTLEFLSVKLPLISGPFYSGQWNCGTICQNIWNALTLYIILKLLLEAFYLTNFTKIVSPFYLFFYHFTFTIVLNTWKALLGGINKVITIIIIIITIIIIIVIIIIVIIIIIIIIIIS